MRRPLPIFYNALLLTAVNLLLRLAGTSFQVYLSGRIGAAGIGLLQLTMSVGSLAMVAGMGGIRTATMYLTAGEIGRGKGQNVTWVLSGCFLYSILFSGTVAAALYHFAPWLAERWVGDVQVIPSLRLFAAFLPVVCLCGVMTGYFTAAQRIGTLAAVEVAEQAVSMGITMGLLIVWAGHDAGRACMSVVLGSALGSILTLTALVFLRLAERPARGKRIPIRHALLDTALPLAVADDLRTGITTVENLMVPKRLALCAGISEPLAAFGMVSGMVFPVIMFPAAILFGLNELLIPELARCHAAGRRKRIDYLVRRSLRFAMVYGLVFGGLLYLLAEPLCLRLYGSTEAARSLRLYGLLVPMLYCDAVTDAMTKGLISGCGVTFCSAAEIRHDRVFCQLLQHTSGEFSPEPGQAPENHGPAAPLPYPGAVGQCMYGLHICRLFRSHHAPPGDGIPSGSGQFPLTLRCHKKRGYPLDTGIDMQKRPHHSVRSFSSNYSAFSTASR